MGTRLAAVRGCQSPQTRDPQAAQPARDCPRCFGVPGGIRRIGPFTALTLGVNSVALDPAVKQEIINEYATHEGDTGSPEVQVAVLTRRISDLTEHLKFHKHDHHSRRGLMILVGRRRNMLGYLRRIDIERYRTLIQRLGIRR